MKKIKGLTTLMIITLVGIISFQGWWLKNNYDREKRSLTIATNVKFQDVVRRLQTSKLKMIDPNFPDSPRHGKMKVIIDKEMPVTRGGEFRVMPKDEIYSTVNGLPDSLKMIEKINSAVVISMNSAAGLRRRGDSLSAKFQRDLPKDKLFQIFMGLDSLQDSLKIPEINKAYARSLGEAKLNVPFTVHRLEQPSKMEDDPGSPEVTVGFVHPMTYQLQLGNTFPYLIKRISLPILFSIFLVGITVLSFLLLYRNILRQQKLAAIKNEFISNITHELKTPIATVGVAIEALKNFNAIDNPQRTREYLDISSNELQRLSLLVDKVLKLSMFEKKEIELKYEPVNLKDVVDEVVASMRLQIEKYNAKLTVKQEGDVSLNADRLHLLSVIFNLLDNALKYSGENPEIHVDLRGNGLVELSVSDNGIGIPAEYQDKIFEKFFRVPSGNKHNAKGYGLGLSYVAHVVKKHNGQIFVDSQPGQGTKFSIRLPKEQA